MYIYMHACIDIYVYLINKPLSAAGILEDNTQGWNIVQKMNSCPRKQSFKGNCEIF